MIWQNPWAWIGVVSIAAPIAVHLLARRQAVRVPFPTLRFLDASSRVSVRRQRVTDRALLGVRVAILVAAVAALAQPFLMTSGRRHDPAAPLVRAIVVDVSASMQRLSASGRPAIADAREQARSIADSASVHRLMETADLPAAVAGAVAWLGTQGGRHEVVVISDFQSGAIDATDVAGIPLGTGVRMIRVPAQPAQSTSTVTMPVVASATGDTLATAAPTPAGTDATWTVRPRAAAPDLSIVLLAGPAEEAGATAARAAAVTGGLPPASPERPAALVFPGLGERAALLQNLSLVDRPWMFDAIAGLARDATIGAAATSLHAMRASFPLPLDRTTVIARDTDGQPIVLAAAGDVGGLHRLIVFSLTESGSLLSASLIAGVARVTADVAPISEFDPTSIPAGETARWERAPTDVAPPAGQPGAGSDGRWLWAAVLALLAVEWRIRQRRLEIPAAEVVHERVA